MAANDTPIVTTAEGPVQGVVDNGVFAFKGIPYAAPPVGDLRWRAPTPVTPWTKTRRASAYGDSSWQNAEACIQDGGGDPRPRDEDCLYLNVWAPSFAPESVSPSRPVLVWIHGGAYILGAGGLPPYTGWPLASRDVVLVTLNYRLGRLGFFAHPALTRERDVPVYNFGLLDQIAALEWVQRNIARFGGNPDNVTLFGQSAGGKSVLALFASPLITERDKPLFHRGVAQSVYGLAEPSAEKALQRGAKVASAVGLDGDKATGEELREVSAERLMLLHLPAAQQKGTSNAPNPIHGDAVLPRPILDVFKDGQQARLPLILGNTDDDSSVVAAFVEDTAALLLGVHIKHRPLTQYYPDGKEISQDELARRIIRDALFTAQTHHIADLHSKVAPSWRYYFSYVAEGLRDEYPSGARHSDEVTYVLNTGDLCPPTEGVLTDKDRAFARHVSEYWLQFARTGTPSSAGGPAWEQHTAGQDRTLLLGETIELKTDMVTAAHMAAFQGIRDGWNNLIASAP